MNTDWVNHSYNNSNNKNSIKLKYDYSKIIGTSEGKERLIQVFRSSKNTDTLKENLKEFLTEEVPVIKATLPLLQFCKGSINDLYYACLNDFINSILHDIENNLPRNLIKYRELLKLTWRYIQVEPFRKIPLTLAADLPIDKELLFIFNDLTDVKVYESCSVKLKKKVLAHVPELKDKKIQDLIDAYVTDPELLQHSKDVLSNVYIYPQQDVVYIRKNNEKFKEIQAFIGNDIGMYDAFTKKIKSMYKLLSNPLLCSLRLDLTINCNIKINAYTGHDSLFSFTHGLTNVLNNFDIKDVSQLENKLNELSIKNGDGILR
ncbi:hypothetical protein K502DRAFT_199206 [Neoconidiobolus thromboides FSU 785]|nr:hypothetical protein K502DRAFT_199206 [Neoconidiobolus thromboides FSU 785]